MTDVLTTDVDAIRTARLPAPTWPTVDALRNPVAVRFSDSDPMLPEFTPAIAGTQPGEKQDMPTTAISVRYVDAPIRTVGNTVDLSLQARRDAGSAEPVVAVLTAATAEEANRVVLQSLQAAAEPSDSIAAAIGAVATFGGPILVITSDLDNAGSLLAIAELSRGRIEVLYDPAAANTVTVARLGVQLEVRGIGALHGEQPALLGHDVATYATIVGPVVSPGAAAVTGLEPAPGTPTAPDLLTADAGDAEVELTWAAPDDDGGSPVTGYRVYRDGDLAASLGLVLTYTDTGLDNGVEYAYQVAAVNDVGVGTLSNELVATPTAIPDGRTVGHQPGSFTTFESYTDGLAILCGYFTTDEWGGDLTDGHIHIQAPPTASDTQKLRLLVYADDGTGDHPSTTLVGVTDEVTMSLATGTGWKTIGGWTSFGGPPTLDPDTKYWLGAWWGTKAGGGGSQISVSATDDSVKVIHGQSGITYSPTANPVVSSWGAGGTLRRYGLYFDFA